ncbi:MAG: KUP/HAK/KT family potassium transporter [Muribaculaceae bacterium]|nr:KUP/HAK/KT family potassium transporter [Muribaculaceae bacterium]
MDNNQNRQNSCAAGNSRISAIGLLITLGIVFGDIGTSPLYVMKAIVHAGDSVDADYVTGAVSCIIWTLTLQTTVKYVLIALRADNHGEGGILALYALIRRMPRRWLFAAAALGASTLIADGVITPAVTVTSAIEGLQTLNRSTPVTAIAIGIITAIFFVQHSGTGKIGRCFGPVMLVWFLMLGIAGAVALEQYPAVVKAFNPYYAVKLLVAYPGWFLILGAVFLCTTGAEALYSDLGHCGRHNITVSWGFVKTMLILNYLGQGAWIIRHQTESVAAETNPFFAMLPDSMLVPAVIMSTAAAIIASQALISGSFTIFSEAMNLRFWPRMRIKYPTTTKGQLYIPTVNRALYVGCIATVLLFETSSRMEAAYGLAITVTMLMTTILLTCYLRHKGAPRWLAATFCTVFTTIEGAFLVANMFKFMHGGWFTILLAGAVFFVMMVWNVSFRIRARYIDLADVESAKDIIADIKADTEIPKYASNVVYISRSPEPGLIESKLLYSMVNKNPKRADRYWILRFETVDDPDTLEYSVREVIPGTFLYINIRLGFRIQPRASIYLRQIVEDLVARGTIDLLSGYPSLRRHGIAGDFRFILIHRIFSAASSCGGRTATILSLHEALRHLGISDESALGLDTSIVTVETVPLIINNRTARRITPVATQVCENGEI